MDQVEWTDKMEDRHIIAYTLAVLMVVFLGVFVVRHTANRRKFKIRQSGRGKNEYSVPAE